MTDGMIFSIVCFSVYMAGLIAAHVVARNSAAYRNAMKQREKAIRQAQEHARIIKEMRHD